MHRTGRQASRLSSPGQKPGSKSFSDRIVSAVKIIHSSASKMGLGPVTLLARIARPSAYPNPIDIASGCIDKDAV